jgi:hypothetical protein
MNPFRAPHVLVMVAECRRAGCEPTITLSGRGHNRLEWCAHGKRQRVFAAATPGDYRTIYNDRAMVRRKLREGKL